MQPPALSRVPRLSDASIDAVTEAAARGPALARRLFSLRDVIWLPERAETIEARHMLH